MRLMFSKRNAKIEWNEKIMKVAKEKIRWENQQKKINNRTKRD